MIVTYEDVQRGLQNRTGVKTLDHIFLKSIERGANCPPFISNAILEAAKRVYNLGNSRGEDEAIKPGQLKIIGTLSSEPAGKPLKQCSTGVCLVTFNAGREDQEILFRDGVTALRRARVLRICEEAHEQGVDLTQEDLAFNIFGCGLRTIRRTDAGSAKGYRSGQLPQSSGGADVSGQKDGTGNRSEDLSLLEGD